MIDQTKLNVAAARLLKRREIDPETNCWCYRGAKTSAGYGHVCLGVGQTEYPHRIAAMIYLGYEPTPGTVVMHLCDNPPCFNPDHLAVGTQKENMAMAASRNRMGGNKLTPHQVAEVKRDLAHGVPRRSLAEQHGVSVTAIRQIATGETWRDVGPALEDVSVATE